MKKILLTSLLLSGALLTAQAQGGYQDDVYSSAPVPPAGSSGNSGSSSSGNYQQRPNGGSFDNGNSGNGNYNDGSNDNGYGNTYADDYDYIDYQNDAYYATRFRRFNDPFYNVGYWSSFWGPWGYGGYGGYGYGGYGYGYGAPGINISIGYGGPYWSSAWGWNNWYGYSGFSSYWNYPYYAGGWGGSPWLGYGQGYNNGYWNGYYAGLYGAGYGYGNGGYGNGYRNVVYGPRGNGMNSSYSGFRGRVPGTDGYRTGSGNTAGTVPGVTDGGRRVRTSMSAPGAPAVRDRAVLTNGDRTTLSPNDRAVRVSNATTPAVRERFNGAVSERPAVITRDGAGNQITESAAPARSRFENNNNSISADRVSTPRGGWFESNSDRSSAIDRQQPVQNVNPRSNNRDGDRGSISSQPTRSFDQQQPVPQQRSFEQPRTMPKRSFDQSQSVPQRSFEQPRSAPQRSFEQPRSMPVQRSFDRPQMSAPSRSFSTPAPSMPSGGGGNFGGMRRR